MTTRNPRARTFVSIHIPCIISCTALVLTTIIAVDIVLALGFLSWDMFKKFKKLVHRAREMFGRAREQIDARRQRGVSKDSRHASEDAVGLNLVNERRVSMDVSQLEATIDQRYKTSDKLLQLEETAE